MGKMQRVVQLLYYIYFSLVFSYELILQLYSHPETFLAISLNQDKKQQTLTFYLLTHNYIYKNNLKKDL